MESGFTIYDVVNGRKDGELVVVSATVQSATAKQWRIKHDREPGQPFGFAYRTIVEPNSYARTPEGALERWLVFGREKLMALKLEVAELELRIDRATRVLADTTATAR